MFVANALAADTSMGTQALLALAGGKGKLKDYDLRYIGTYPSTAGRTCQPAVTIRLTAHRAGT